MKSGAELINPYDDKRGKTSQVEEMFDSIAHAYDFMNTAMSFGMHRRWRDKALDAVRPLLAEKPREILDIASGTGDVAFELGRIFPDAHITGIDLSENMLQIAREKLKNLDEKHKNRFNFQKGDSLDLSFDDNSFDCVTVAYGVRNFENLQKGLLEMHRVLKPGGILCIIELSEPSNGLIHSLYNLYSRKIIPFFGKIISGDSKAYSYLPASIAAAPQRDRMTKLMDDAGLRGSFWKSLNFGVVTYYIAGKDIK